MEVDPPEMELKCFELGEFPPEGGSEWKPVFADSCRGESLSTASGSLLLLLLTPGVSVSVCFGDTELRSRPFNFAVSGLGSKGRDSVALGKKTRHDVRLSGEGLGCLRRTEEVGWSAESLRATVVGFGEVVGAADCTDNGCCTSEAVEAAEWNVEPVQMSTEVCNTMQVVKTAFLH